MTSHISEKTPLRRAVRRSHSKHPAETDTSPDLMRRAIESPDPSAMAPETMLQLQRVYGNQYVSRLVQSGRPPAIQACKDCGDDSMIHTQRMDIAQRAESVRHGGGCGCPSCGRIQRENEDDEDGGEAVAEVALSEAELIDNWVATSTVKGFLSIKKPRSTAMKQIDTAVATYKSGSGMPGNIDLQITNLTEVKAKITAWRRVENTKNATRVSLVKKLELLVDAKLIEQNQRKAAKALRQAQAEIMFDRMALSGGMDQYAKRAGSFDNAGVLESNADYDMSDPTKGIQVKDKPDSVATAFTLPRNDDGTLSDEAIEMMNRVDTKQLKDGAVEKAKAGSLNIAEGVTQEQIQGIASGNLNSVTGKTQYPELENALNPSEEDDAPVTESIDCGGVSMNVTYNKSDSNFGPRLGLLKAAIQKVLGAGFSVPSMSVNMPKFGRQLTITADCQIKSSGSTERAMFVAPDFIHMSSEGLNNPITNKKKDGTFEFSSTEFDASGVGTVVHELGHALHYHQSPSKYHELAFTSLKGLKDAEDKPINIADVVSTYGSQKPREFVAEVFLGLMYGRKYPPKVMEMYNAFGGPKKG